MKAENFIRTWEGRPGNEIANAQSFLNDLCGLLGVPRPHTDQHSDHREYGFERPVTFHHANGSTSPGRIDLYRRSCFVLEAKQGSEEKARIADPRQHELITGQKLGTAPRGMAQRNTPAWTAAMLKAKGQAYAYARALEPAEGWPPFLIVVDIGHVIDVYADFTGAGKNYAPFPDGTKYRIRIADLADAEIRQRLKAIWENPLSLDPTRTAAKVTRQIAAELAELGKSFEGQGHTQEATARFLMRCLFTMFAEDVELIPPGAFTGLLDELRGRPKDVAPTLEALWKEMDKGGHSGVLRRNILHFNGGLFAEASALPVNNLQLGLLIRAAEYDWKSVEPAIFGTLMERALSPKERHKLGAHFTPRSYVERLVGPTILEPLRADWLDVQTAAVKLEEDGKLNEAIDLVREFKRSLCNIRVLDPACGSGNFLYVALEGMKRLEGEISEALHGLGDTQVDAFTVDPHQFLGIEKNPWAAAVAELVLWIGYLQWHFRTFGKATPSQPVLKDFHNIENRDALLDLKGERPRVDENGKPVTRWDGESYITHPVTGERVPDPEARVQIMDFESATPAKWPKADFIVGNPPFIGARRINSALGDEYVSALRRAYKSVPNTVDFVMYWWARAAEQVSKGVAKRFGLITTNSITQDYSRPLVESFIAGTKPAIRLMFAVTNHPWVDSSDGAAVRIAMTVGARVGSIGSPKIGIVIGDKVELRSTARIHSRLTTGPDFSAVTELQANAKMCFQGVVPAGDGFKLNFEEARALLRADGNKASRVFRKYIIGKDLTEGPRHMSIIDFFGLDESEARRLAPHAFQRVKDTVKPHRDENKREQYKKLWWIFAEPRPAMRNALAGIPRYVATPYTAVHRTFMFVDQSVLPDAMAYCIASDRAEILAVLSSKAHAVWCRGCTGTLEDRPRYNSANTFAPFAFPDLDNQRALLRELGDLLDAHRKARQKEHPALSMTRMYNVLEKVRAGEAIEGKDKTIYDQGLIGILKDIHDRIDAAVADAYGWPADLSDEQILERLVALNRERKLEEAAGKVRWLRPDYQNPTGAKTKTTGKGGELDFEFEDEVDGMVYWPKALPVQVSFVRAVLSEMGEGSADQVASRFVKAPRKQVQAILESLAALGQARTEDSKRFAA